MGRNNHSACAALGPRSAAGCSNFLPRTAFLSRPAVSAQVSLRHWTRQLWSGSHNLVYHKLQTIYQKYFRRNRDTQSKSDKDLIRFDKLDTRTSAPVYGSYSARDHENRWLKKQHSTESGSFISHAEKSISESYNTYNSFPYKEVGSNYSSKH